MKTTVNLDDVVYAQVVSEAVRLYGNTRHISEVINECLRKAFSVGRKNGLLTWKDLRGTLKTDVPTQKLKDLARGGWEQ